MGSPSSQLVTSQAPPDSPGLVKAFSRRPRILLAASGSVAAIKFPILAESLSEWADVKAVVTEAALHFVDKQAVPCNVPLLTGAEEWTSWKRVGDDVLHIELRRWADALVVAPTSANTLAKVAGGICDNLLTCIVRAWDFTKPMFLAPAMNTFMWNSPFTARHLAAVQELGVKVISPISKKLACGDVGNGAMAEPATIEAILRTELIAIDLKASGKSPSATSS
eukprot:SM000068S20554  [mRNA]  locus=s68:110779:112044:+ [translate_table: standard]